MARVHVDTGLKEYPRPFATLRMVDAFKEVQECDLIDFAAGWCLVIKTL